LQAFDDETPVRLTALVTLEDEEGNERRLFLGPQAGGMKVAGADGEIVVVTPSSPLGRSLLGRRTGDEIQAGSATGATTYTIVSVA